MLVAVTTADYLSRPDRWGRGGWLPNEVGLLPEVLSLIALIGVLAVGTRHRFRDVPTAYWALFGGTVLLMIAGAVANGISTGETVTGMRLYFRAMPFFFVPLVFRFSESQVRRQLGTLLAIALVQVPIAFEQRLTTAVKGRGIDISGDYTSGTLLVSSILSIFLICAICVVTAYFLKGRLKTWHFVVLVLFLFFPTTINETKGTLFLLPIGLSVVFFLGMRRGFRLKAIGWLMLVTIVTGAGFWMMYDYIGTSSAIGRERTLSDWWTDDERREALLTRETELGGEENAGRLDSITVPARYLSRDVVHLMLGLGIGSVANSSLGPRFVGRYHDLFEPFMRTAFPRLLLDLGILGLLLIAMIYGKIFRDAVRIGRVERGEFVHAFALGWTGVVAVMAVSIFYKDIVPITSLSYLFWYGSGLVVSAGVVPTRSGGA
jgi:hypothetical protein